jgi:hypothetical protein
VQERFFRLITAPEGVVEGLKTMGLVERDVEEMICSDERRTGVERLDIYANMYFYRILDVLRDMYPKLTEAVGDAPFHNLITSYLLEYPSSHPSLRNVGEKLPAFLDAHQLPDRPWLSDLARLEWARHDVFDLADADALTMELLRGLDPNAFAGLALPLIPALRIVRVKHSVEDTYDDPSQAPAAGRRTLLVWRQGSDVYHRATDEREAAALAMLERGTSFGLICEWLGRELPEAEAPQAAFGLLAQWATDEILVRTI